MKILNVVYSLGKGGTERAAQNFAFGYADIGCESRIMFTREDGPRREYIERRGILLFSLQINNDCQEIKKWNPDIVHIHSHGITIGEFKKIRWLFPNSKYVETNVFSRPSLWADSIDLSLQLSQWCQWLFKKRSKRDYPSAIIPNPIDPTSFARVSDDIRNEFRSMHGVKTSDLVIGRVGQHFKGKWSPVLIDIFNEIRRNDSRIKLLLVNPPQYIVSRALISKYRSDIIHIEEIHGDDKLSICYSSIDVFVLIAEQGESFGMVLAESLLCETPVVALSTPWGDNSQGEVIGNGIGGLVAANKNELSSLIKQFLLNDSQRKEFGRNGRERIIRLFDSKVVAKNTLALIGGNNVVEDPRNPYELMLDSKGVIDILSKIILKNEKLFFLLIYTLGYRSFCHLPFMVLTMLKNRLVKLVQALLC